MSPPLDLLGTRQGGVVAVLMLLVLLTSGAFYLLRSLNAAGRLAAAGEHTTHAALAAAKRALLGYAVRYPDHPEVSSPSAGPGLLPCPDTRLDAGDPAGQADPPCARSSGTETGLFPWRTLDAQDARDGSGAPLWYAVSDAFRNNPAGIVNSATLGQLRRDGCSVPGNELVALIIAPGPPLAGQDRAGDRYAVANFLEGENASTGDGCFATGGGVGGNDTVLAITHEELMRAVENRVAGDVARALARYHRDPDGDDVAGVDPDCPASAIDCDDGFPWAAPFANPAASDYAGAAGTSAGLLPLRRPGVPFGAPFQATWRIPADGSVKQSGSNPPSESCVRDVEFCSFTPPGFTAPIVLAGGISGEDSGPWGAGQCELAASGELTCRTEALLTDTGSGNRLRRQYAVTLGGIAYSLQAPTATERRLQSFMPFPGALSIGGSLRLVLTDTLLPASGSSLILGVATLTLTAGDTFARLEFRHVPFDLEIDTDGRIDRDGARSPGELPAWFSANRWHELVALAFPPAEAPGVAGDCGAADECLVVTWNRPLPLTAVTSNDARGLVLLAGRALAGQARPSPDPGAYYEDDNASLGLRFTRRAGDVGFNDRVRLIEPAP